MLLIASIVLFSCSKKEQYYGAWTSRYGYNYDFIKIKQDSIAISTEGNQWNTYPVTIKNNSLTFLNHTFKSAISKEGFVFNGIEFKKDTVASLLEIKLPELKTYHFHERNPKQKLIFIKYGKVPNSDEFKLQLNDRYADFHEILDYFYDGIESCSKAIFPTRVAFICDKDAKMKDLEFLFHEMVKMNMNVFYTVNHIEHEVVDNNIEQKYFFQKTRITPIYNMTYQAKINNRDFKVQYDYLNSHILKELKLESSQYLFLINNTFYIGKEKYNLETFTEKVNSLVSKKPELITLFDLNSDYKHFTIFNAVINDAYNKRYNVVAKQKYNTTYEQLNDDEKYSISSLYLQKNIQNISIPHFLSFKESPDENVQFPFKNVKEQIPEAYFEQSE